MKLQADRIEGQNAISRHAAEGVVVNGIEYRQSVIVPWRGTVASWPVADFAGLTEAHFEMLAALAPELVIFGSGRRIRFALPGLMRSLMARRIGLETMDTAAACRTYNVLLAEGRSVVAALLFEPAEG
ncbi:MAG: Mth938-like domain-containing protein [Pseudomonadota bacterium]|nr:Mth938-like domain-containing protein [Pseudomonadota bacterium]